MAAGWGRYKCSCFHGCFQSPSIVFGTLVSVKKKMGNLLHLTDALKLSPSESTFTQWSSLKFIMSLTRPDSMRPAQVEGTLNHLRHDQHLEWLIDLYQFHYGTFTLIHRDVLAHICWILWIVWQITATVLETRLYLWWLEWRDESMLKEGPSPHLLP